MSTPKKFFFDVWLAQGKTVYRDVPYEIVTDWIQQGRLLGDDRIRPAKTEEWFLIDKVPAFAGFVPKTDPLRTDAKAEAMEPVETGFHWGKGEDEEEADPDMIPLIDVSLVLLIFFMLTSTVASGLGNIPLPAMTKDNTQKVELNVKSITVVIRYISETMPAQWALRVNTENGKETISDLNQEKTIKKIEEILQNQRVPEIHIVAHKDLNFDILKDLAVAMEQHKADKKVGSIKIEVGEKK